MIKFVKLKQRFDGVRLQEEVNNLESALWKPHYNLKHYEGGWATLPLRSINGDINNHVSIQRSSLQENMACENTFFWKKVYTSSL